MANEMAKRLMARVRELRKALDLSQEAFAERAGLKYKHYQALEAGRKADFKFSTLQKLAKACRLEPYELLNFDSPIAVADDRRGPYETRADSRSAKKPRNRRPKS